jgi:hypothetical protein
VQNLCIAIARLRTVSTWSAVETSIAIVGWFTCLASRARSAGAMLERYSIASRDFAILLPESF